MDVSMPESALVLVRILSILVNTHTCQNAPITPLILEVLMGEDFFFKSIKQGGDWKNLPQTCSTVRSVGLTANQLP